MDARRHWQEGAVVPLEKAKVDKCAGSLFEKAIFQISVNFHTTDLTCDIVV